MSFFPGMYPQSMAQINPWQQIFTQFQMYLQQSQILFDSFNYQMKFSCFQSFLINMQNPLAFQPMQMQNQVFQQFLMWRQNQQPQPQPQPQPTPPTTANNANNNGGVLQRDNITEVLDVGSGGYVINVTMSASTGHKVVIKAGPETTIEELLKMYMKKMGLSTDSIGKDVMFLFNGAQLEPKSQDKIGSKFRVTAAITVYDLKGIIGA
jgi:hypothetical protein